MANPLFTGVVTVLVVVIFEGACPPDCTLYSALPLLVVPKPRPF